MKLRFSRRDNQEIVGYCGADWVERVDDHRSTQNTCSKSKEGLFPGIVKKQLIALSTTEAEYITLTSACQEAQWLRKLEKEAQVSRRGPLFYFVIIKQSLTCRWLVDTNTKHRPNIISERELNLEKYKSKYVSTDLLADIMIKPPAQPRHLQLTK